MFAKYLQVLEYSFVLFNKDFPLESSQGINKVLSFEKSSSDTQVQLNTISASGNMTDTCSIKIRSGLRVHMPWYGTVTRGKQTVIHLKHFFVPKSPQIFDFLL